MYGYFGGVIHKKVAVLMFWRDLKQLACICMFINRCSDFKETIQQQGPIGGMPPQNFEKNKHEIVRFRGIFAVKRRYEILAEMSILT